MEEIATEISMELDGDSTKPVMPIALVTGAHGMLGSYVRKEFAHYYKVITLGLNPEDNIICDLTRSMPHIADKVNTVVHCAGTEEEENAEALNKEGTLRLLEGLEKFPPENFIYISSFRVYGSREGENLEEGEMLSPSDAAGRAKIHAERLVTDWCAEKGVILTILRPVRMFGSGVKGEMKALFEDAANGHYIHIRGNDACLSIVTALDVARCAVRLVGTPGIFNVSDGMKVRLIDLVEAMTENAGSRKRPVTLPEKWAQVIWKAGHRIKFIDNHLNPGMLAARNVTQTCSNKRVVEATGISFYDTLEVISRSDKEYPYENPLD